MQISPRKIETQCRYQIGKPRELDTLSHGELLGPRERIVKIFYILSERTNFITRQNIQSGEEELP